MSSTAAAIGGSGSELINSLTNNSPLVGTAWVISSAILTTYSTTMFLKYDGGGKVSIQNNSEKEPERVLLQLQKNNQKQQTAASSLTRHSGPSYQIKSLLESLPRTTLLTLFRFAGSFVLGLVLHVDFWLLSQRLTETFRLLPPFFVPALLLFVANWTNSISLDRIGISLTYTSKCGIPLMTVLLTLLLDGRRALPSSLALLSLIPIAVGIAAASWSAPTFELLGFMAALVSTTSQSALNVSSKRALLKTGVTGPAAQRAMVAIGLALTVAVSLVQEQLQRQQKRKRQRQLHKGDERDLEKGSSVKPPSPPSSISSNTSLCLPPAWLSIMALSAYHLEYALSFMFVKLVQPITYGTCDAVRRLAIILTGRAFFGGAPLTLANKCGIALALLGALSYSVATTY